MIKLTQNTLPDYFTIADRYSSWYQTPVNTFNFVDRNSRTLVVTVGDSWTWGSDIAENNSNDAYRLEHLYGNIVSQEIAADWLNLGLSAQSNLWTACMVEELAQLIPNLDYKKIYVICPFTGVGRWFFTNYDQHIHYPIWVNENVFCARDFNKLLVNLNQGCVDRISAALQPYSHVTLKFGTTFVDPVGFDSVPQNQVMSQPWYRVMGLDDGITSRVCMDGVKGLLRMPETVIDTEKLSYFKEWILDIIPASEKRNEMLKDPTAFRAYHPMAQGHRQWAEYLLTQLETQ